MLVVPNPIVVTFRLEQRTEAHFHSAALMCVRASRCCKDAAHTQDSLAQVHYVKHLAIGEFVVKEVRWTRLLFRILST